MSVRVAIQPAVLRWAVERMSLAGDDLKKRFPAIDQWLSGEAQPTLNQAKNIAKQAKIPFGRLLLDSPSGDNLGVADFRTVKNTTVDGFSPDLREVIIAAQNRLNWYSDYAIEIGIERPELVGLISGDASPVDAARKVRMKLGLAVTGELPQRDKVVALTTLLEHAGILVSRNSVVENSTTRPLNVEEFRGFTLIVDGFALVFINTEDAKTAQLFSLAHELGHIVLNRPGISDHHDHGDVERWCNAFAAHFLAPSGAITAAYDSALSMRDNIEVLAPKFGMSREAMLWRFVNTQLLSYPEAEELLSEQKWVPERKEKKQSTGGPPRHLVVKARVGKRFFDTVAHAAESGEITEREAARYLGAASHDSFRKLMESSQAVS